MRSPVSLLRIKMIAGSSTTFFMKNCTNRKLDNAREKENEELFSLSLIK
jgi:hypothetical protein